MGLEVEVDRMFEKVGSIGCEGEEEIAWFGRDIVWESFDRSLSVSYFPRGLEIWQML